METVGGPGMTYKFGASIAVDSADIPHLAFYDQTTQSFTYGTNASGKWVLEAVDGNGDAGKFASIAIDSGGRPHISYYVQLSERGGLVRYAYQDGSGWSFSDVGPLEGVDIAFIGARNSTQLQLDPNGSPLVAYSGSDYFRIARQDGSSWAIQTVVEKADLPLGQQTSFRLAADGSAHVSYFDVADTNPLKGQIHYAKGIPTG